MCFLYLLRLNFILKCVEHEKNEPQHVISDNVCEILIGSDSDEPVQPPFKTPNDNQSVALHS